MIKTNSLDSFKDLVKPIKEKRYKEYLALLMYLGYESLDDLMNNTRFMIIQIIYRSNTKSIFLSELLKDMEIKGKIKISKPSLLDNIRILEKKQLLRSEIQITSKSKEKKIYLEKNGEVYFENYSKG